MSGSGSSAPGRAGVLAGRTIVLGVAGGVAAYKAAEVARGLVRAGARVLPVLTRSAERFVGAVTFSGLTGEPVRTDMWDASFAGELHVDLARRADLVLVVPATADLLARLAAGRADDLLAATVLCARGPVLVAPAMHPRMWGHPATMRNVATLRADGRVRFVGPVHGEVASGEVGLGRLEDPEAIVRAAAAALAPETRDLAGARFVVTAGPTYEPLDPVRFLGNRSSGKMGFALAERAAARGAEVTLVAGPVGLATPQGVTRIDVGTTAELASELDRALGPDLDGADVLVMAAAVADYRPRSPSAAKLKKGTAPKAIELDENPDVLAGIGARRRGQRPVLVGFALETGDDEAIVAYATKKRASKKVDLVVANAAEALGKDESRVLLVGEGGVVPVERLPKGDVADRILDAVARRLAATGG